LIETARSKDALSTSFDADRDLVFVRLEARGRTTGLELSEPWAHLVTVRNGRVSRLEQFRNRDEALEAAGLSE
jgi:ketosteroid isomerase-like protein